MNQFGYDQQNSQNIYFNQLENFANQKLCVAEKVQSRTQAFQNEDTKLKCRSKKLRDVNYKISFETNLLDSHIAAFCKFFGVYQKKLKNIQIIQQSVCFFKNIKENQYFNQDFLQDCLKNMLKSQTFLSEQQFQQILLDWKYQSDLTKFLIQIFQLVNQQLIPDLLYLTFRVWQKYLELFRGDYLDRQKIGVLNHILNEKQIQNYENSKYLKNLTLNINRKNKIMQEALIQFTRAYIETIFLVLEGYFDNPFADDQEEQKTFRQRMPLNQMTKLSSVECLDFYQNQTINVAKKMPRYQMLDHFDHN